MSSSGLPSRGVLAQVACLLEVTARKPGNVHRLADFQDSVYLDFVLSAGAMGAAFDRDAHRGLGQLILGAVLATRQFVRSNTNLGMILLLAPLVKSGGLSLRQGVASVLRGTTRDDASQVYRAIRAANPGGLGAVDEQDVANEPQVTLRDAMILASDRDAIARQYATDYADVLDVAVPALRAFLDSGHGLECSIVGAHLRLMASCPDTLIRRKRDASEADESARRAHDVLASGWPHSERGRNAYDDLDAWLRSEGHERNPGATADLIAAALFVALDDGTIPFPITNEPAQWTFPGAPRTLRGR
ncbi:MAG: triphosphoribosyl-dephospho-CoA synthase [Isosphaeraceae bacterium]